MDQVETTRRPGDGRRRLVAVALASWAVGTVHLVDHVIRGELVVDRGLDPLWNHSGWPFQPDVTLFTVSAVAVQVLVLGGVIATLKGRLWAGYWLGAGTVLGVLVTFVHFVPGPRTETPRVIFSSYQQTLQSPGGAALGVLAVTVTVAVLVVVGLLIRAALDAHRRSGQW